MARPNLKANIKQLWQRPWFRAASVLPILVVAVAIFACYHWWPGSGFGAYTDRMSLDHPAKTLWDWMELLIIPAGIALAALWFDRRARTREREIEAERAREAALQTYLDRMSELVLKEGLRHSTKDSEVRQIARARTLATLRQLDGARKGLVLRFLCESQLVSAPRWEPKPARPAHGDVPIDLSGADLRGAQLPGALIWFSVLRKVDLTGADLSRTTGDQSDFAQSLLTGARLFRAILLNVSFRNADLSGADLTEANLSASDLEEAVLRRAVLRRCYVTTIGPSQPTRLGRADLTEADLTQAVLYKADLTSTDLSGAMLNGANLRHAKLAEALLKDADLTGADLTGATITPEQLAQARSLRGATMPDGTKHE